MSVLRLHAALQSKIIALCQSYLQQIIIDPVSVSGELIVISLVTVSHSHSPVQITQPTEATGQRWNRADFARNAVGSIIRPLGQIKAAADTDPG